MARRRRTKSRRFEAQPELPLDYSGAESASHARNPSRWQEKVGIARQARSATNQAKRGRLCIAPASSIKANITKIVGQSHPLWLTSLMSDIISKVVQNGWPCGVFSLPSLESCQEP